MTAGSRHRKALGASEFKTARGHGGGDTTRFMSARLLDALRRAANPARTSTTPRHFAAQRAHRSGEEQPPVKLA